MAMQSNVFSGDLCVFTAPCLPYKEALHLLFSVINSLVQVLRTEKRFTEFCKSSERTQTRRLRSTWVPLKKACDFQVGCF